jgi:peroxiredoxin
MCDVKSDIGGMSVWRFAMFVDDFGVKFVVVEELSEDVGESSMVVAVVVEKGVELFGSEG